jgi:alpha-glucosidase (family GH31 glycosyl hydrolase)
MIETPEPGIVRLWFKSGADFVRQPSLATEAAPTERLPMKVSEEAGLWFADTGRIVVRVDSRTLEFSVLSQEGSELLRQGRFRQAADGSWSFTQTLAEEERLYGLGQDNHNNGRLDRRGVLRDLWAGQQINSGNVTAQYPVPFLLSSGPGSHAYGLFLDNVHHQLFDLGAKLHEQLRVEVDGGEADLYIIDGPTLEDLLSRYTLLTGRPPLPPLWAFGYWQSKCTYYDWKALDEAYNQLDAHGFPVDAMVIDADWPEIVTNYRWAQRWYPAGGVPADKIRAYRSKGVRIVTSQSGPAVKAESSTFATGWAAGVFATDGKGNPVECCYYGGKLIDFTHPGLKEWLWPQLEAITRDGISAWWLDLTEPEGEPPQTTYFGGARPASVHNQFSLLCTRNFEGVQLAVNPGLRPFILNRCASAGSQRYHQAVWTGDVYSDYATYRAHPPEMLNSGLSGLAYWTSDSGGFLSGYYKNDQMGAHARLYERWMQLSAFSPIARAHKAGGLPEPYAYGPTVEQSTRHYLKLRYRLLPYLYSHAWQASRSGIPLVRPMVLGFPGDEQALASGGDQYLFGRFLLVAPVMHEGQSRRTVHFPKGLWYDWDTGLEYQGGRAWVVDAPQNRIPVAVRAGAIIPMAPDMRNTAERPWDPLTIEAWPEGSSSFDLYADDGTSFAYRDGDYTVTRLVSGEGGASVIFGIEESNKRHTPARYLLRLHLKRRPLTLDLDGVSLAREKWTWDEASRVLALAVEAGTSLHHVVQLKLEDAVLPARPAPELEEQPIDESGEAKGGAGKPMPHFFPAPTIPASVKAINYDKGGEGVAFHSTRPAPFEKLYNRADDFGIVRSQEAGGFVLGGLSAGEWIRYSVDCGRGGLHDLSLRLASAGGGGSLRLLADDRVLATVAVPATGGAERFVDVEAKGLRLPPGELSLLLLVDSPSVSLAGFHLAPSLENPALCPAVDALRNGIVEVGGIGEAETPRGYIRNFGKLESSLAYGLYSPTAGTRSLRLRYSSRVAKGVSVELRCGDTAPQRLVLADTKGVWTDLRVPVEVMKGNNAVLLSGLEQEWDNVNLLELEFTDR